MKGISTFIIQFTDYKNDIKNKDWLKTKDLVWHLKFRFRGSEKHRGGNCIMVAKTLRVVQTNQSRGGHTQ